MEVLNYVDVNMIYYKRINGASEKQLIILNKRLKKLTEWCEEGLRKHKAGLL